MLIHDTACRVGATYASWHVCIMVVGHAFEQLHRALHCAGSRRTSCTTRGRRGCGRIVVAIVSSSWPSSLCPKCCGHDCGRAVLSWPSLSCTSCCDCGCVVIVAVVVVAVVGVVAAILVVSLLSHSWCFGRVACVARVSNRCGNPIRRTNVIDEHVLPFLSPRPPHNGRQTVSLLSSVTDRMSNNRGSETVIHDEVNMGSGDEEVTIASTTRGCWSPCGD